MLNVSITTVDEGVAVYVAGKHILTLQLDSTGECNGVEMHEDVLLEDSDSLVMSRDPVVRFLRERENELEVELQHENYHPDYTTIKLGEVRTLRSRWEEHLKKQMEGEA